jgi:uncharacterized membrane protein
MRSAVLAALVVSGLSIGSATAQTAPAPRPTSAILPSAVLPAQAGSTATADPENASLGHSALKATTFKAGSSVVNFAVLSLAAGGAGGGAVLTLLALGASWTLYTANDYLWDRFDPAPVKQHAGDTFDATEDLWRNTKKFLTYKPAIAAFKYASIFLYTGSAATTLVAGTVVVVANTGVFYVNNTAWDFYDWYTAPPAAAITQSPGVPEADLTGAGRGRI